MELTQQKRMQGHVNISYIFCDYFTGFYLSPITLRVDEIVVLKAPKTSRPEHKKVPWVGVITNIKSNKIEVIWLERCADASWEKGGKDTIKRIHVLAKFRWNLKGKIPFEDSIWEIGELQQIFLRYLKDKETNVNSCSQKHSSLVYSTASIV